MVEGVEGIHPELRHIPLVERQVLGDGDVSVEEARSEDRVTCDVANLIQTRASISPRRLRQRCKGSCPQ